MFGGGYSKTAITYPPHDYQKRAINWLLTRLFVREEKGAGLFLDPGLGKTRVTLSVMDTLFKVGMVERALVVAPLRPVYTVWPDEFRIWGFPQSHIILHKQYAKALACNAQVELVNYEGLVKLKDIERRWDLLIIDESTFIKNWSAKRTKYLRKMIRTIPRRIILTGTPASNSLHDLHAQLFMVDDGESLGRTVTAFRSRYCIQGGWKGCKWLVRPGVRNSIQAAIKDRVLRMQAEDHLDMPELVQHQLWVELPKEAAKEYRRLKRELFAQLETGEVFAATAASAYGKCRQFANGQVYAIQEEGEQRKSREYHVAHKEKLAALQELASELSGKPLLVLYSFTSDVDEIKKLPEPFRSAPVVCGDPKYKLPEAKLNAVFDKWNKGELQVLLCQWQSVSHGLNLQKGSCQDIACFGVVDSLDVYEQAYRRVYRQGFKGDQVRVHRILTRGTVDEVMLERLQGKHESQTEFLNALKKHAKEA